MKNSSMANGERAFSTTFSPKLSFSALSISVCSFNSYSAELEKKKQRRAGKFEANSANIYSIIGKKIQNLCKKETGNQKENTQDTEKDEEPKIMNTINIFQRISPEIICDDYLFVSINKKR